MPRHATRPRAATARRPGSDRPPRRWIGAALLTLIFCAASGGEAAFAPSLSPERAEHAGRPAFRAEIVPFQSGDSAFVAVRVTLPYSELSFRLAGARLEASFDLILILLAEGRQVGGDLWHERIEVPDREALRGRRARYERQILLPVEPGKHVLEIVLSEPESGHEGRVRVAVDLPLAPAAGPRLSPLLIGPCGLTGRIAQLLFDERIRTEFSDPPGSLCAYAEVSRVDPGVAELRVRWRLESETGAAGPRQGEFGLPPAADFTRLTWALPTEDLLLETYRLIATVDAGGAPLEGRASFGLLVESDQALGPFFRDMLPALAYIAGEQDLVALRMAAPGERREIWNEFWARRDPTPETERNEFKEEFFERLKHANAEFGTTRPGWMSDRGRVYIRHGAPDAVERMAYRPDGLPTEIWLYEGEGLRFVFVDRGGYGDYILWQSSP